MEKITIQTLKNGPLLVKGNLRLEDADGKEMPLASAASSVALCRCGASKTKPFCDGTHKTIGFEA